MACDYLGHRPPVRAALAKAFEDQSAAVRQALVLSLWKLPAAEASEYFRKSALHDPAPEVRASGLTTVEALLDRMEPRDVLTIWCQALKTENDPFVLRVALRFADIGLGKLLQKDLAAAQEWCEALVPEIERLHVEAASLSVRRWAAGARDRMWCRSDPNAHALLTRVTDLLEGLREGERRSARELGGYVSENPALLGRVMAVLAQSDHGVEIEEGGRWIVRGDRFRFRLWRLLYELRHPATEKRQAFPHSVGRVYTGTISAPSGIMAEVSQTAVPGEPLVMSDEAGWRPYLPLPDQVLSAANLNLCIRICTSEGVTELSPPRGFLRRRIAGLRLSFGFARFAQLRNWTHESGAPPTAYVEALHELGFQVRLAPHESGNSPGARTELDPAASRFFPALVPVFATAPLPWEQAAAHLGEWWTYLLERRFTDHPLWERMEAFADPVYGYSIEHLTIFIAVAIGAFVARQASATSKIRRARRSFSLVFGGWGTRGKSGTERLKAALLSGLGYSIFSKTTGCEAMFLHGRDFGKLHEMFLFRPYDKASIWEQMNVAVMPVGCVPKFSCGNAWACHRTT